MCAVPLLFTWVVLTWADIPADIRTVSTREGEDAILPCGLDSPVNLEQEVFDWKRDEQEVFFYDMGKHYNNNGRGGQDPQFVGRVRLLPGGLRTGNASVILSDPTEEDSGVYKCIFPHLGLTRRIRLIVERVPNRPAPKIQMKVVEPRLRLEIKEAPLSSGWARLCCVSRGGQPQPRGLEWQTQDGNVIPAEGAPTAAADVKGHHSISQCVKVTEPGIYTCLVRQEGVHPAVRDTIQVFGNWQSLTSPCKGDFWNYFTISVLILLLILSFGVNLYQWCTTK